jgi:hypothetical protein
MTLDGCEWGASYCGRLTMKKQHPVATNWVDPTAVLVNLKNSEIGLLPQLRMKPEFLRRPACSTVPVATELSF